VAQARGRIAQTQYSTFGGISPEKAHHAFARRVPAGGFDGQEDANFRYHTRVGTENSKDNRKCLADALLDPELSPKVGLAARGGIMFFRMTEPVTKVAGILRLVNP
jgi:hypothetical protein